MYWGGRLASNHLEDLVAQWYEYRGFFVRRNVQVGPRPQGGYECELDVVAFRPGDRKIFHIEPSLDADSWAVREFRYQKKFAAGKKYIPDIFSGLEIPDKIEQIALLVFASKKSHSTLGGGKVVVIKEFMEEIRLELSQMKIAGAAVPEQYPLLRTLQFAAQLWDS